ncbi:MAG TPA: TolC family protein [Longimicrobiaceae bacterium]|jgi:outer membrane protein TolC|nr:TolC family protein [Longimicrobiaceae bacterium]
MRKARLFAGAALLAAPHVLNAQEAAPPRVRLSLADAIRLASDTSASVVIGGLRVEEAQARVAQARSVLLPDVTATANVVNQDSNLKDFGFSFPSAPGAEPLPDRAGPVTVYNARPRASQTLYDPAAVVRLRAARAQVPAAGAERDVAVQTAGQRAGTTYLRAERAAATIAARQEDIRIAQELLTLAQAQLRGGIGTGIDVTRAQTQLATAQSAAALARNQLAQANVDLARALGVDPATRFELADGLSADAAASGAEATRAAAVQQALAHRAELRSAEAQLTAAELGQRAIHAERLPRVDVSANYGIDGPQGHIIDTHQVALQVSVPVFDGGRRTARESEQGAVIREIRERSGDIREQVAAEVESALLDISSGAEQQAIAADRLRLAESELSQARERFSNGIAGNVEVINAQSNLIRARDAVIDARFATAEARVNLARAVGMTQTIR